MRELTLEFGLQGNQLLCPAPLQRTAKGGHSCYGLVPAWAVLRVHVGQGPDCRCWADAEATSRMPECQGPSPAAAPSLLGNVP